MDYEHIQKNALETINQAFDLALRDSAAAEIVEPEYAVVFEIRCRTSGHSAIG